MFRATISAQDPMILQLVPIFIQACEILKEEFQHYCAGDTFNIEKKADHSPVTQADYRANRYITEALAKISDLPVLSEEADNTERNRWQKFWLLDPLDGTKEFLHKRPEFTINLSLVDGAATIFAALAIPSEQSIYFCPEQGMPVKLDITSMQWFEYVDRAHNDSVQIGLSQSSQQKPQYAEYLQHLSTLTDFEVFKAGSAYKFCMMLEDRVDIYPRFHPTCEWDTSAGQCLLERIGGGLVDFSGRSFTYNQRETLLNDGFIAFKNAQMKHIALQALQLMQKGH